MAQTSRAKKGNGDTPNDIISAPEACKVLRVHRNTLYRLIQEGEIPAFKLLSGGQWRFRREALEQWIDDKQGRRVR